MTHPTPRTDALLRDHPTVNTEIIEDIEAVRELERENAELVEALALLLSRPSVDPFDAHWGGGDEWFLTPYGWAERQARAVLAKVGKGTDNVSAGGTLQSGRKVCPKCGKKGLGFAKHAHALGWKDYTRAICRYCHAAFKVKGRE